MLTGLLQIRPRAEVCESGIDRIPRRCRSRHAHVREQQHRPRHDRKGYSETSMAEIASAVGIPISGIYRYFPGKCDILATGLRRAADRVSGRLSAILTGLTEPGQMLTLLIEAYVAISFANPDLAAIYYTERVNLTRVDQELLRSVQRSTIDAWMRLLAAARPALTKTQARVLVHAAMALVVDVGRLVHYENSADNSAYSQACVRKLMEATVFGTGG
ncbi:MAG TPA: TetR/AcrR family transcriptional regulator [Mycobacterium sp.]|uniref:TetR/AcrR family transcriptional regulator n=1 Tax=Mycobacterium sp. TaxID=1785 RepID=UPI002F3F268A